MKLNDSKELDAVAKAIALQNSRPLNLQYKLDAKPIAGLLRKLYNVFSLGSKGKHNKQNRRHLRIIVSDLVRCYQEDPEKFLALSMKSNDYNSKQRYNTLRISYRRLKQTIDLLVDAELVQLYLGIFFPGTGRSAWTRIRATDKLIALLRSEKKHIALVCSADDYEPIQLREGKPSDPEHSRAARGKLIDYEDTAETIRMRAVIREYVRSLHEHKIENPADNKEWEKKPLIWRKFCNSVWDNGGRIYGGNWQNCKRELRQQILIDGEPTIELDYVALHGCLAYAKKGIGWWERVSDLHWLAQDPYGANWRPRSDKQWRYFFKKALNIALAASSVKMTLQALNKVWMDDQWRGVGKMPMDFRQKGLLGTEMRRFLSIQGPHADIADLFFLGIGLNFQYWDSRIAEMIFQEFTLKGKVVLGIHDSFIVKESDKNLLMEVMTKAYVEVVGFTPKFK